MGRFHIVLLFFILLGLFASCNQSVTGPQVVPPETIVITPVVENKVLVTAEVTRLVETEVIIPVVVTRKIIIEVTAVPSATIQATPTLGDNINFSGTYVKQNGVEFYKNGGCILSVIHELVLDPFDNLSFELFCNRGEPSYNMGYARDDVLFENHLSKTAVWSSSWGECHLVFEFGQNEVEVTQVGHSFDCGFGHAVYAGGTYSLKDSSPPNLGCLAINSVFRTPTPCTYYPE